MATEHVRTSLLMQIWTRREEGHPFSYGDLIIQSLCNGGVVEASQRLLSTQTSFKPLPFGSTL